jgi:serine/threonine protein kinase
MVLPLQGRLLEEKFRLLRKLGKGGMASVWLATNTRVDREVAIKLIRPEVLRNEELVARFRSEAKAAGRIDHPNVCDILDFGIGPVGPYIVMEYLRGRTLSQMIKLGGPMQVGTAAKLVRQALSGLIAAHANGIVHRDLKPENVFLHETPGGEPVVKIMDFGVAKLTDGSSEITTEQGALLGTPEYMAPEQFLGADMAEARTDLWAVGAILYRALTGEHAFKGPTVAATLMRVTHDEPSPLRSLAPGVPEALEAIVCKCLAKKPADRFENARVLRDALAPFEDQVDERSGTSSLRLLLDRVMAAPDDDDAPEQRSTPGSSLRSRDTPLSALPKPAALPDPELSRSRADQGATAARDVAADRQGSPRERRTDEA